MSEKIKRGLVALAALGALALGGAAIAGATSGNGGSDQSAVESEQGEANEAPGTETNDDGEANEAADENEANEGEDADKAEAGHQDGDQSEGAEEGDGDGELPAAAEQKAQAAAEWATGGKADGDVEPAEQSDPVEDKGDQPTPKNAAYEVEVTKGGQALKVFLDSSFNEVATVNGAE